MTVDKIKNLRSYELVNYCEIDKYASKAYSLIHNVDESLNLGDITKVKSDDIDDITFIVGGSPCQDFSLAGKKAGVKWICKDCGEEYNPLQVHYTKRDSCPKCNSENIDKTRSSLLIEYLRMIRDKKPKFALYENVKNIIGKQFKESFEMFLKELDEYGYNTYYKCLNAKDYGIPQNRERVYLIIIKKDVDNGKFEFPEPFKLELRLRDFLEDEVDEKYYLSESMKKYISAENEKWTGNNDKALINKKIDSTINTGEGSRRCDASNYITPNINEENVDLKAIRKYGLFDKDGKRHQAGSVWDKEALSPTLDTMQGGYRQPLIEEQSFVGKKYKEFVEENGYVPNMFNPYNKTVIKDVAPTQTTQCGSTTSSATVLIANKQKIALRESQIPLRIRKLTPKECWRLMGFNDQDVDICIENNISNTQLYKMAGNSIVVDVLYYIFLELYKAMPYLFDDLRVLSLFSGIGAPEKALDRLYENINN